VDDRRLKKLFQFNDADLFANREGRLSENQHKRLAERARAEQKSARESSVILFVIAAGGLIFGLLIGLNAPAPWIRTLFLVLLSLIWPLAWAGRAVSILRSARSLDKDQLQSRRGRVHIIRHSDPDGGTEYVLQLDDLQFDLDGNPTGVLSEGDECVVYYLKEAEEILSVEWV
jgi:hypothetical protein